MANENYLIDHWSYSSIKDFISNRYKFLQVHVLKVWKWKTSPSMLVGDAGHVALETILKGSPVEQGIAAGLARIERKKDEEMNWGETGSREKVIKKFSFALNAYLAEMPTYDKVLAIEEKMEGFIKVDPDLCSENFEFALPASGVPDVVEEKTDGTIVIHDHKFVTSYTKPDEARGSYYLQAWFYFHLVWSKYEKKPVRMIFHECKTSENQDGRPQLQDWSINFSDMAQYFTAFYKLYDACSIEIGREDCMFLPNILDMQDGEETLKTYAAETVGIERPVAVKHKTEDVELTEKRFIPSTADRADNKYLTDEEKVRLKLQEFGLAVDMRETFMGNSVIKYTFKPSRGVRMRDFEKYDRDMAIALKAETVRIEAPIMGTDLVGVEVPNPNRTFVKADLTQVNTDVGSLLIPVGMNVYGATIQKDLRDAPHLLVAGATGSGKSVFINVLIQALMAQHTPQELQMIMIDPKRVELSGYKGDPHLMEKPIYEVPEAQAALMWLVEEMETRYTQLESVGAKSIDEYNTNNQGMCKIVVVIDEFADLMLQTKVMKGVGEPNKSELAIVRLAQKARAVGIHLVLGTQRPSVDVVTGLIKSNLPCRIAFRTAAQVDSRVILDQDGAETLIGKGDMLFLDPSARGLQRLQSFYV